MNTSNYERLSALDHSFLLAEKPSVHMHVAAVQIFEAGPLKTNDGGVDFEAFERRVAAVLHLAPRCRQRIEWTPFEHHPIWVDDREFDLGEHVLLTRMPRPGTDEQFKAFAAEILEHQLDRSRPLWEIWVVEGLSGDRFAVVSKFHHCMIDGALGADLLSILFSPSSEVSVEAPEPYLPRRSPRGWELSRDSWQRWMDMPGDALRAARKFSRDTTTPWEDLATGAGSVGSLMGWAVRPASDSPLNGTLDARRRIDWTSTPLDDVRAVGKAAGCSLNDVVLATVAGAVRRFLIDRGTSADIDFRISAPINTRRSGEEKLPGNHVSAWIVPLPTGEEDPSRRITAIAGVTRELKRRRDGLGMEWLTAAAEWAPAAMLSLGVRLASGPINMVVTNVPGPAFPLFMLGARLEALHPVVPLLEGSALGIALFSYNGTLCWGFNAGHDLLPDLGTFVGHIDESFAELAGTFGVGAAVAPRPQLEPSEPDRPSPDGPAESLLLTT
jgi:diacylglycerol O-acyltransferase